MYVILTYDVVAKRDPAVLKICRKYLHHAQRSVFEGNLTEAKLKSLKYELKRTIDEEKDHVRIYSIESLKYTTREDIGLTKLTSNIL